MGELIAGAVVALVSYALGVITSMALYEIARKKRNDS